MGGKIFGYVGEFLQIILFIFPGSGFGQNPIGDVCCQNPHIESIELGPLLKQEHCDRIWLLAGGTAGTPNPHAFSAFFYIRQYMTPHIFEMLIFPESLVGRQ
jgi:hypothetical protein